MDEEHADWVAEEHAFRGGVAESAEVGVSRSLESIGPNATRQAILLRASAATPSCDQRSHYRGCD
jgi:hypothetical protein